MEVLTNEQYKDYSYTSRYSAFPFYYNKNDGKYVYGVTKQLATDIEYVAHTVTDKDTLDSLALKYYGRPDYYWIIADFNRIRDPFTTLKGKYTTIKVPSLTSLYFKD